MIRQIPFRSGAHFRGLTTPTHKERILQFLVRRFRVLVTRAAFTTLWKNNGRARFVLELMTNHSTSIRSLFQLSDLRASFSHSSPRELLMKSSFMKSYRSFPSLYKPAPNKTALRATLGLRIDELGERRTAAPVPHPNGHPHRCTNPHGIKAVRDALRHLALLRFVKQTAG